jgi:hypothetical protein
MKLALALQAPLFLLGSFMQRRALTAFKKSKCKYGYVFEVSNGNFYLGPEEFVNNCKQAIAKILSECVPGAKRPFVTKGVFFYPETEQLACNCDHNYYNKYFSIPKDIYLYGADRLAEYFKAINKVSDSMVNFRFLWWKIPIPPAKENSGRQKEPAN